MGYGVYDRNGRWCGYGVPAFCDHPGCGASIDRGLAYLCGGDPMSDEGCGLFFCSDHLWISDDGPQVCQRCDRKEPPFDPTPDTAEWVIHMLTDQTWETWRRVNPDMVTALSQSQPRDGEA